MADSTHLVQEILAVLGDGCVILDRDGICQGPISASAPQIFEKDPMKLHFTQILGLTETEAPPVRDWFKFLFSKKVRFDDVSQLGPNKFKHSDSERAIGIHFKPIRNAAGEVEQVAMIATDLSSKMSEKKRMDQQQQESEMIIARYRNFPAFARCLELYQECVEHYAQFTQFSNEEKVEELRREIHSLKGILGICSIADLVQCVRKVESDFLAARKNKTLNTMSIKAMAQALRQGHEDFMMMNGELLSLGKFASLSYRAIEADKIEHFRTWLKTRSASAEILDRFSNYFYKMSLAEILEPLRMYTALQGARLQKPVEAQIECPEVFLEPQFLDSVLPAISKAITAAIQDSIEDVEERQTANKPREGQIKIRATFDNDRLKLVVEDDGKWGKKVPFEVEKNQQRKAS